MQTRVLIKAPRSIRFLVTSKFLLFLVEVSLYSFSSQDVHRPVLLLGQVTQALTRGWRKFEGQASAVRDGFFAWRFASGCTHESNPILKW
jgi:hypothetical protein